MKAMMLGTGLALAIPLAACMTEGEPRPARAAAAGGQCFNVDRVDGFDPIDRDTVDLRLSRTRVFRLELSAGCEDVNWAQRVGVRSRSGGRFVCSHFDAELFVPSPGGGGRCFVTDMRALSQAEIDARRTQRR